MPVAVTAAQRMVAPSDEGWWLRVTDSPRIITRIINMINEQELTGELRGDFTELRVLHNGEFIDVLALMAANTSGVNDIQSGGGLAVSISNGIATITNTAQGSVGPSGGQGQKGNKGDKGDK